MRNGNNKEELLFIKGDELEKLCGRTKCTIINTPNIKPKP